MQTNIKGFLCKTCAHKGAAQNGSPACVLHKKIINPDIDFCSDHINQQETIPCDFCGQSVSPDDIRIHVFNDSMKFLCSNCSQIIGTCQTCNYRNVCGFNSDHTMPAYVSQTIKQGFMTMQTQVKNPALIDKHCISCRCSYGNKGDCLKDVHGDGCPHWVLGL